MLRLTAHTDLDNIRRPAVHPVQLARERDRPLSLDLLLHPLQVVQVPREGKGELGGTPDSLSIYPKS